MNSVYTLNMDPVIVSPAMIGLLIESAGQQPYRRARLNLHQSPDDPLHEMVIAFRGDSLNLPHRHPDKSESLHVMHGALLVVVFDDTGAVTQKRVLDASEASLYRMNSALWHTVIPLDDPVVVHEVTNGPFRPGRNMEIPPWAPKPSELADYIAKLKA